MKESNNILKKYLLSFMPVFCIAGFLIICINVLMLNRPIIIRSILDFLNTKKVPKFISFIIEPVPSDALVVLLILVSFLIIFSLFHSFLMYVKDLIVKNSTVKLERKILADIFLHILKLDLSQFNAAGKNEIRTVYLEGYSVIRPILEGVLNLFSLAMKIIVSFIFLWYLDYKLLFLTLPMLLIPPLTLIFIKDKFKEKMALIYKQHAQLIDISNVIFNGYKTIKNYIKENYFLKYYRKKNLKLTRNWSNLIRYQLRYLSSIELIVICTKVMVLISGGYFVAKDFITIGKFIAFIIQYEVLQQGIIRILNFLYSFKMKKEVWDRIYDVFQKKEYVLDLPAIHHKYVPFNTIEFKNIYVNDEDINILKNINFKLTRGSSLGIIGTAGSGKTSILNLLEKFIEPTEGEILIDGININTIPSRTIRKNIQCASQNSFLFNSSIRDNINFGRECKTIEDEDYMKIRKLLNLDDFLSYPKDYELCYGREIKLSGGQRQRLCLARTLLAKPKVLLVDEALSGFDAWNEEFIIKNFTKEFKDLTKIIVTNRITTLRNVDYIIVLVNGEIVESGTHDELIAQMDFYADFYNKQVLKMDVL